MLSFLGAFLTAIKPLWIWGVVASSIGGLTTSGLVLHNINKKDPDFKEYYKSRGFLRNTWHFLKSSIKLFIPIFNVFYGFYLLSKLFNNGISGLREIWKDKIFRKDNRFENLKKIGNSTKRIGQGLINRIKYGKDNTQSVNKTNTTAVPVASKPVAQPVVKKTPVQSTQPVVKKTPVQSTQPVVKNTQQTTKPLSTFDRLSAYFDSLNNSNIDADTLISYYKKEYWTLRKIYNDKIAKGLDAKEEYSKLVLIHDKCVEFKQMRGLTNKPVTLTMK